MDRWACESELHEGSRTDVHRLDRFTRRETFMRVDGAERLEEKSKDRLCRECIRKEKANLDQGVLL
jgi:hypothetical protein